MLTLSDERWNLPTITFPPWHWQDVSLFIQFTLSKIELKKKYFERNSYVGTIIKVWESLLVRVSLSFRDSLSYNCFSNFYAIYEDLCFFFISGLLRPIRCCDTVLPRYGSNLESMYMLFAAIAY